MRFFEFGKEMGKDFLFLFIWEGKGKEIMTFFGKEREGFFLVWEGNGKEEMSIVDLGRK